MNNYFGGSKFGRYPHLLGIQYKILKTLITLPVEAA